MVLLIIVNGNPLERDTVRTSFSQAKRTFVRFIHFYVPSSLEGNLAAPKQFAAPSFPFRGPRVRSMAVGLQEWLASSA